MPWNSTKSVSTADCFRLMKTRPPSDVVASALLPSTFTIWGAIPELSHMKWRKFTNYLEGRRCTLQPTVDHAIQMWTIVGCKRSFEAQPGAGNVLGSPCRRGARASQRISPSAQSLRGGMGLGLAPLLLHVLFVLLVSPLGAINAQSFV